MENSATSHPTAKFRNDYQAPDFLITSTNLDIDLNDNETVVTSILEVMRNGTHKSDLVLNSEVLSVAKVLIDDVLLDNSDYIVKDGTLEIRVDKDQFTLSVESIVDPSNNKQLEGLYKSEGVFCTQCEAEGFRKITPYLDRPDVLSVFTVSITADASYPNVLANGNLISKEHNKVTGRVTSTWHDPFPKPSYLFAMVAGDFDLLEDKFTTRSGREIALELYVDKGNLHLSHHAMNSLKKSMEWDEIKYDLEYDLDNYMVVAVDFFNMGAMENKGLNIFNSKYVLADSKTATDTDYHGIESVIAHEYFHNWTGNRVTCRDWFQLSLKEGLTVYRDQQFSADMGSAVLERISHANVMRTMQFAEDAGPMTHPIRPEKVIEMNNFYTVTVYDKGAEVIRMMNTLLTNEGFKKGIDLYFKRHDGQAVTCDDFVNAMSDANNKDLSQFSRWYSQSGTPVVNVTEQHRETQLTVSLEQSIYNRNDDYAALTIPVKYELLSVATGQSVERGLIEFNKHKQDFTFKIPEPVDVVLFEDFSAPVKVDRKLDMSSIERIIRHASDQFCRWDMLQTLWKMALNDNSDSDIKAKLVSVLCGVINDSTVNDAVKAEMLTIPSFQTLADSMDTINVDEILSLRSAIAGEVSESMANALFSIIESIGEIDDNYNSNNAASRSLRQSVLKLIAYKPSEKITSKIKSLFENSTNMTDKMAAIQSSLIADKALCDELLDCLYKDFPGQVLVFDKILQIVASRNDDLVYEAMELWSKKPEFVRTNPNRMRSLYGAFVMRNPSGFHNKSGKGYEFLKDLLLEIDAFNPQLAARLVDPLMSFKRFESSRAQLMKEALQDLQNNSLSNDLFEKVEAALQ
ncbi:aminopeptidase N [Psychrosphaera sp.]|nr:aminopeptidase N [Psychrosphaera sp.]